MKAFSAVAALVLFASACSSQPDQQGTAGSGSSLSSIDLKLPSKDGLSAEVAAQLSQYRLTVTNRPSSSFPLAPSSGTPTADDICANIPVNQGFAAEIIQGGLERVGSYTASDSIGAKIRSGCYYNVKLEVGNQVSNALRDEKGFDTFYVGEALVYGSSGEVAYNDGKIHVQITLNLAKDKANSGENLPGSLIPADKDLEIEAKFGQGVEGQGVPALR